MNSPATTNPAAASGQQLAHESAIGHVSGQARYVDDIPEVAGTLHAAPVLSQVAHGRFDGFDQQSLEAVLAQPGVNAIVQASDLPAGTHFATPAHDEPILASGSVCHVGQVMALVVAESHALARSAAATIQKSAIITPLPAILTIRQAVEQQAWVLPPVRVERGDPVAIIAQANKRLSGSFYLGGQEHFYLEGQAAYALPLEDNTWLVHSGTQHPGEVQHWIAAALGLNEHSVDVVCRRMGGGFGGKETQGGHLAVWAALAARRTGQAVKMRLDRDDDFMVTGKRHDMLFDYQVGFDGTGRIAGLVLTAAARCGFSADLSGPVNGPDRFPCG